MNHNSWQRERLFYKSEHFNKHQRDKNELEWQKLSLNLFYLMVHVPSSNMDEGGFMTYTAASHQGVIKKLWLHFWGEEEDVCNPRQQAHIEKD